MVPFSSADFSLPPRDFEQDDAVSIGWQIRQAINNIKTRKNTQQQQRTRKVTGISPFGPKVCRTCQTYLKN
jgi:hypothetical protein